MGGTFVPSLSSQARAAELNAASAARARNINKELDDFNELASSQPIPLTALSTRTHSRNKGSKSWRPLSLQDVEESVEEANFLRSTAISGTHVASFHTTAANGTDTAAQLLHTMTPVRHDKQKISANIDMHHTQQRHWSHGIDGIFHKNPLNQYLICDSPSGRSSSEHNHDYISTLPFSGPVSPVYTRSMQNERNSSLERETKQAYRGFQPSFIYQDVLEEDPFTPQFELPLYASDSYSATGSDHSRIFTGPEVSYRPIRQQEQLDTYRRRFETLNISENMENEFRDDYSRYSTVYANANSYPGSTGSVCYPQTPKSLSTPSSNSAKHYDSTKAKSSFNEGVNSSKKLEPYDTKKEMAAYLNSVVEASKSSTARTVLRDPVSANKGTSYVRRRPQEHNQDTQIYPSSTHDHKALESKEVLANVPIDSGSAARDKNALSMTPVAPKENENKKSVEPHGSLSSQYKTISTGSDDLGNCGTNSNAVKFPPPGLPTPAKFMDLAASVECFPHANSRLVESNAWFHTDNRGEKQFRQRVRQIAREDAQRRMRIRGDAYPNREDVTAVQITVLLGDVLANIQSYIGRPCGEFANFGNVPPHCCEPSHGGRRSYFDRDPSIDQWRLPSGRATFDRPYRPYQRAAEAKLLGLRRF
ncbi:hypothetical protein NFIA_034840 [Paecilomyces variotii No. 5]|uniref:Uncharacterized protein n=1 Tax=Byssochlamys spectabilis (strain No. 5 / NBRC 109023) TaxID=1356009 RepID=V5FU39_BYSSN|nr:hypothetical protein NFIA_034840 [Paecilomyces variotii No. 5]